MELSSQLRALLELAESLGITIRRAPAADDRPAHPGGALVRLRGQEILFWDPTASPADQINVVAAALRDKRQQLENRFIPPEIRQLIEHADAEE